MPAAGSGGQVDMRVITDPKTGRMSTEHCLPPVGQEELDRVLREVKDIVAGNTRFHVDPWAAPVPLPVIDVDLDSIYEHPDWQP